MHRTKRSPQRGHANLHYRGQQQHHGGGGGISLGKRPIWFVGALVFVSVFAWTFRFREAETDLILSFQEERRGGGLSSSSSSRLRNPTIDVQRRNEEELDHNNNNKYKEGATSLQEPDDEEEEEEREEEDEEGNEEEEEGNGDDANEDDGRDSEDLDGGFEPKRDSDEDDEEYQEKMDDREENEKDEIDEDDDTAGVGKEDVDGEEEEDDEDEEQDEGDTAALEEEDEDEDEKENSKNEDDEENAHSKDDTTAEKDEEETHQTEDKDNEDSRTDKEEEESTEEKEEKGDNNIEEDETGEETQEGDKKNQKEDANKEQSQEDTETDAEKKKSEKLAARAKKDSRKSDAKANGDKKGLDSEKNEAFTFDPKNRPVYFLNRTVLGSEKDAFSASWLQRTEDFMTMNLESIGICEDAAFRAFWKGGRKEMLRETADWLDFSIEHMSKWWKILNVFRDKVVYDAAISKFGKYIENGKNYFGEKDPAFKHTIAVIAAQAYKDDQEPEQAFNLTLVSLGATIESLRRAGFGRVVVVGNGEKDETASQETFRYVKEKIDGKKEKRDVSKVGHMEVGFAEFSLEDAKTQWIKKNVPRGTLFGLRHAFTFAKKEPKLRARNETEHMKIWLGDHDASYWEYVYLTEPDSILQSRPSTLATLKEEVDKGTVLIPHRLQPIPHESDVRGSKKDWLYLQEEGAFKDVMELDSIGEGDVCCDKYEKDGKPWKEFGDCGNFWYMCGFSHKEQKRNNENRHDRLKPYGLIRLKQGTGIVSLASLEHGRPCIPKKNAVCKPPHVPPYDSVVIEQS